MKLKEKIMKAQKNMEMVNSIMPKLAQEIVVCATCNA